MAQIATLKMSIDTSAAEQSIASLASVMQSPASPALGQILLDFDDLLTEEGLSSLVLFDDGSGLLGSEPVDLAATGASKIHRLRVFPNERYVELMSAIAGCGDAYAVRVVHGWPILSVADDTATVTEAGGESIPAGEGATP